MSAQLKLGQPVTPQLLLALAQQYEALRQSGDERLQGTAFKHAHEARIAAENAAACARWMQAQGLASLEHVGPFSAWLPRKGQQLRVRKGALVRGGKRDEPPGGTPAARAQAVVVDHFHRGYVEYVGRDTIVHQPLVVWAGAGGRWRQVDPNQTERIAAVPAQDAALQA